MAVFKDFFPGEVCHKKFSLRQYVLPFSLCKSDCLTQSFSGMLKGNVILIDNDMRETVNHFPQTHSWIEGVIKPAGLRFLHPDYL